jgi:hypothetical protein
MRNVLRVISLLAVAVLAAGCAGAPIPASAAPRTSSSASATPSLYPSESPTPTMSPASATSEVRFEQVAVVNGAELHDVVEFGGGFVIAGCRLRPPANGSAGRCADALVMHSTDGHSWTDAVVSGGTDRRIVALARTPLGLLAFGSDQASEPPQKRAVWRSDDGMRWEPFAITAPTSIVFRQAVVLDGRTVLLGFDSAYDFTLDTEAWATTDGRSWTRGRTPLSAKIATHPGLVAIGDECVDVCSDDLPLKVFRSINGLKWTQDAPDSALAGAQVHALGSWIGRAVIGGKLGSNRSAKAALWFDDPTGWRAVQLQGGSGYSVAAILDLGGSMLVEGRAEADGPPRAWSSSDSRTWHATAPGAIWSGQMTAYAGRDPIVVIVDGRSIWASES